MQNTKKALAVLLAVLILALSMPFAAFAEGETPATSGTCGPDATWSFADGTLTISGTGATDEYNTTGQNAPWNALKKSITKVVVGEGVTQLSKQFMYKGSALKTVELPESLTTIGRQAFLGCTKLESINFPASLTKIVNLAFDDCGKLKATYPGTAKDWDEKVSVAADAGLDNSQITFHVHEYKLAGDNAFVWSGSATGGYTASKASFVCDCGATKDVTDIAISVETPTEAGCEKDGLMVYTATPVVEDETYGEGEDEVDIATYVEPYTDTKEVVLPATGHSVTKVEAVPKTCEEAGNIEYWVCSKCEKLFSDEAATTEIQQADTVVPASHAFGENSKVEAKTPDCIHEGNIAYWVCDDCGKFFADNQGNSELTEAQTVIPATGIHAYGDPKWTWNEDQTAASATFTCTVEGCGHSETKDADVAENDKVEPTCGEDGYYQNKATVLFENNNYEDVAAQVVIPATGEHVYGEPVWSWSYEGEEVTATATFTCTVCGDEQEVASTSVKQSLELEDNKQSSCTENGFYYLIATVNFVQTPGAAAKAFTDKSEKIDLPLKDHTLTETGAQEATCTEAGNIDYWTCAECGQFFSDEEGTTVISEEDIIVPAAGHTLTKTDAKEETCVTPGNIAYWTCDVCGAIFSDEDGENEITEDDLVIPAGHKLIHTDAKEATCTENGNEEYWTCSVCANVFLDEDAEEQTTAAAVIRPAIAHQLIAVPKKDATCEQAGNKACWVCTVCEKIFSDAQGNNETTEEEVILPKLDHNISGVEFRQSDEDGKWYAIATCTRHLSTPVMVLATWVIKTAATCGSKEKGVYSATINGKVYTSDLMEKGEPLEHNYQFDSFVWASDYKTAQAKLVCSNDNSHTKLVAAEMTHETTQPTCEADGYTVYTATYKETMTDGSVQNHTAEGNQVDVVAKLPHDFTGDVVNHSNGTHSRKCTMCGLDSDPVNCSFGAWAEDPEKQATCTEAGQEIRTCNICGYPETRTKNPLGHDFISEANYRALEDEMVYAVRKCMRCGDVEETQKGEWVVITPATHTSKGTEQFQVKFDNADLGTYIGATRDIAMLSEHNFVFNRIEWIGNDTDGYTGATVYVRCSDNDGTTDNIDAVVTSQTTPATCEAAGKTVYTATYTLGGEEKTETKEVTILATGHDWADWTKLDDNQHQRVCKNDGTHTETANHNWADDSVTTPASCEAGGEKVLKCADCGATKTVATDPTGHTPGAATKENEVPATCSAEGSYDEVIKCTVCGNEISRTKKTTDKLAHTPGTATKENEVPATCSAEGSYEEVIYCTVCDAEISRNTKTTDKLAHTPGTAVKENEVPATCFEGGSYDEVIYCSVCSAEISREPKTTAKLTHSFTNYVYNDDATCDANGTETAYCDNNCGESQTRTKTGSKLNHDYRFASFTWADDYKSATANLVCANDPSHTSTATATVTSRTTAPDCENDGYTVYTARYSGNSETKTVVNEGSASGHDWGKWSRKSSTEHIRYCQNGCGATEVGEHEHATRTQKYPNSSYVYEEVYCPICEAVLSSTQAHDHVYDSWITRAPTCSSEGEKTYRCTICGQTKHDPIDKDPYAHYDNDNNGKCDGCGQKMTGGNHCKYCGKIHNGNFMDKLTGFFHRILGVFVR